MIDPADFKKLNVEDQQKLVWEAERTESMYNLYFLSKEILGYKDMGEVHKPVCKMVESVNPLFIYLSGTSPWKNMQEVDDEITKRKNSIVIPEQYKDFFELGEWNYRRLFLMFRSGFKSTLITVAHSIQIMLLYPDVRILIASHKKEDGAEPFLKAIKHHFMFNDRFRDLFPEYCPRKSRTGKVEWGTQDSATLPNRSSNRAVPESTIECAGINTNVTGRHYDVIKADDLVTKDSVNNEGMLRKTQQQNALLDFLFDQPEWGVKDVVGTPYHFADLYSELRRSPQLSKIFIPISFPNGNPVFYERFSKQGVHNIKNSSGMTVYDASCQYDLNPVPAEDQTFRPEWFEQLGFYYDTDPKELKKYMFVDPANSRKKGSDFTAICIIGIDHEGIMYLLDIFRDKMLVEERTNKVIELAKHHNIKTIHYESIGFQDTDSYIIRQKCHQQKYNINIVEIKSTTQSKEDRIRGLQPIYQNGGIRWKKKYEHYSKFDKQHHNMGAELKLEMLMFPKSQHDDMVDCHSFILQVRTAKAKLTSVSQGMSHFEWIKKNLIPKKGMPSRMFALDNVKKQAREFPYKKSWN